MRILFIIPIIFQTFTTFSQDSFIENENHLAEFNLNPKNYPELYYEIQIAYLNKQTDLSLFFDPVVREYIHAFLTDRANQLRYTYSLSAEYFPLFEKYLDKYQIPPEIKYLPVVESGLSPVACSPSLAKGLWQFKEKTGSYYGLEINSFIDEREDPELSTIAACKYLKDLFGQFGSWDLALLAYNTGPTTLRNAMKKTGEDASLNEIIRNLPDPAQRYLPALVSIIYLFHNYEEHFSVKNI